MEGRKEVRLNLGCGREILENFVNVDGFEGEGVDMIWDLDTFPYPFKDNSVDYILASHILEHLKEPKLFLDEMGRILKHGGRLKIKVPHCNAMGAYACFGHRSYYHEIAIKSICFKENYDGNDFKPIFKLIKCQVKRGRFLKWQKREIIWIVEKR